MIHEAAGFIAHHVAAAISASGYPAVILLMAIESACIPLPSEIIMPFSGYLVSTGRFTLLGAAASGALGNLLGSVAVYWGASFGVRSVFLRHMPHHVEKAEKFYATYGTLSVFIGRLLPVVRTFISLPAGILRTPFVPFCFWTFAGSLPWCYGLAYLGMVLGRNWKILEPIFHRIDLPIAVILVGGIAAWTWRNRD